MSWTKQDDICLSIAASLGNTLIIIALQKVSSIHPPTKLLFQNQAVTDLCVGLIVQPLHASITIIMGSTARLDPNTENYVVTAYQVVNYIAGGASLLSPAAISIDRLLALRLGVRYRHIVTLKRARVVVCCIWLTGLKGALMYLTLGERITLPMIVVVLIVCGSTAKFLLHENILQTSASSSSSSWSARTVKRNRNSTEHQKI